MIYHAARAAVLDEGPGRLRPDQRVPVKRFLAAVFDKYDSGNPDGLQEVLRAAKLSAIPPPFR